MRVTPIELDSNAVRELRSELEDAVYESGRSTIVLRMPDEPSERFGALVAAAEIVLKVASEPRPNR
jgi:transcription-repair coupling factor (superfamily II helicase)